MSNVAVVGFGRIGRSTVKAGLSAGHFSPKAICDIAPAESFAALFEYDSNYGRWKEAVTR